jgi:hypothetical protein
MTFPFVYFPTKTAPCLHFGIDVVDFNLSYSLLIVYILSGMMSIKLSYPLNRPWRTKGCDMLRIPHCLDNRLIVNCEILATCSSTYSPVRTSQEAHSISIQ